MNLVDLKNITPEVLSQALTNEGLSAYVDKDNDVIINTGQLMVVKINKEKSSIKFFGSVPFNEKEQSSLKQKESFINKMNNILTLTKFSLFEGDDNTSLFFEVHILLSGWVSSDFLSGIYNKGAEEVLRAQSFMPYISVLEKED